MKILRIQEKTLVIEYFFVNTKPLFKGTVSVISSDPQCKKDDARFTRVPSKPLSDQ